MLDEKRLHERLKLQQFDYKQQPLESNLNPIDNPITSQSKFKNDFTNTNIESEMRSQILDQTPFPSYKSKRTESENKKKDLVTTSSKTISIITEKRSFILDQKPYPKFKSNRDDKSEHSSDKNKIEVKTDKNEKLEKKDHTTNLFEVNLLY